MRLCVLKGLVIAAAMVAAGCATPLQQAPVVVPVAPAAPAGARVEGLDTGGRPVVGLAFGGGSARGIAHVGVLRWLEEHRIPVDVAAGTSMGGLIGGSFATGMSAAEVEAMITGIDWDAMFGTQPFAYKNIRRKADSRAYPSRLEFGLKGGLVAPTSLNNGEQVELLIARVTAPYDGIASFDELPTPFRTVAVDLVGANKVVLDRGSLAKAMRASMSLPLVFPPVEIDGRVLVDGGAMDNVPVDEVRAMGADRVIAVNVGDLSDPEGIGFTMLGVAGATLDAMMRSTTRAAVGRADVVLDVPLKEFGSLDWRRSAALIQAGYDAAEAMRDRLLPLAVSEDEFTRWLQGRDARRKRTLSVPAFVDVEGFAENDVRRLRTLLAKHVGVPIDVPMLELDLAELTGLDRYETIVWRMVKNDAGDDGVMVTARLKSYAPPFMMLGFNLDNTTSTQYRFSLAARYLSYGVITSGSELRIDAGIGSVMSAGAELYEPVGGSALFVAPFARVSTDSAESRTEDTVTARYDITSWRAGIQVGTNLGRISDVRVGWYTGYVDAGLEIGDPSLPSLRGSENGLQAVWRYDSQDSPQIPSHGLVSEVRMLRVLNGPDGLLDDETVPLDNKFWQLSGTANRFWRPGERHRLFVYGGLGTTFDEESDPIYKFTLGTPLRLAAYQPDELRGSNYYVATGGYLHRIGRLPDFLGGPIFTGAWLENGDTFEDFSDAKWRTNVSGGIVLDTLFGPATLATSAGFDGRWRVYISVGRLFR